MDFGYPLSISGELPSRPKPDDILKQGSGSGSGSRVTSSTTTINAEEYNRKGSTSSSVRNDGRSFPQLKGTRREQLNDFYVANESELTKHISIAAGSKEILWGSDQWFMRWYEASPSHGMTSGAESHSMVKHVSVPPSRIGGIVDAVLARCRGRRLGWVVGPGNDTDQGLQEVVLVSRGLLIEDEQPVMVVDLDKALSSKEAGIGGRLRPARLMPLDPPASFSGRRLGRPSDITIATSTISPEFTRRSTSISSRLSPNVHVSDVHAAKPTYVHGSRLRPREPQQEQEQEKWGLADYQLQLMLLEQQNSRRLTMPEFTDRMDQAVLEQEGKKGKEEYRRPMTDNEKRTLEKSRVQREHDWIRLTIENAKKRREFRERVLHFSPEIKPLRENKETYRTTTREWQQQPEKPKDTRSSNPALHDYNMQLKILEQVNKNRLMRARKEQDDASQKRKQPHTEREHDSGGVTKQGQPLPVHHGSPEQHHYQTLDLFPEQIDTDAVFVEREDAEQEQVEEQRKACDPVETSVGAFHPLETGEDERGGDDDSQHRKPELSPLPGPSAPERKCRISPSGIMVMLLVSPREVEDWVRTWAHEAYGARGEADIKHWTGVYRTLLSTLPSSQFAMYIARDISLDTDNLVGTGYLHLHSGVASVSFLSTNTLP